MCKCQLCGGKATDEVDFWQGPGYLLGHLIRTCACRVVRVQHPFTPGVLTCDQMTEDLRTLANACGQAVAVDRQNLHFTRLGDRAFRPFFRHQINQRSSVRAAV